MKKFLVLVISLLFVTPLSFAVLNERDLAKTLEVLKDELSIYYKRQQVMLQYYKLEDERLHTEMLEMLERSNKTALILYSQKKDYTFDLAYACNEATQQYESFISKKQPYYYYLSRIDSEIERYNKLIDALLSLPPRRSDCDLLGCLNSLDSLGVNNGIAGTLAIDSLVDVVVKNASRTHFLLSPDKQLERDSCVIIATNIRNDMMSVRMSIQEDYEQYTIISEKLERLNAYAKEKYKEIRQSIFDNKGNNFISILLNPNNYIKALIDIKDKYLLTGEEHVRSDWKGPVVLMFTFFVLFYLIIAIVLCNAVIYFIPEKYKNQDFKSRQNYYITAGSMVVFSIVMYFMSHLVNDNFFKMASSLIVDFTLLMSAIILSLLYRLQANRLKYGVNLYLPVISMGFFVIFFRVIFVPNSVVNLVFPVVLLVATLFQLDAVKKYNSKVLSVDKFYTWISLATIAMSCLASWMGFTLFAVQIFMWWMMQLTCIHGITCCCDAMVMFENKYLRRLLTNRFSDEVVVKKYLDEESYKFTDEDNKYVSESVDKVIKSYRKKTGEFFKITWLGDLLNITVIPVLTVLTVPLCIYWAAGIFDMNEAFNESFATDYVNIEGICQLSLRKLVVVFCFYYVFKYINYMTRAVYRHLILSENATNRQANLTLANNVISIIVWGIFIIFALVLMRVPKSGISIVTAGLATGIGFAMKDIINNFFYGISLMAGRVKVGEMIECDGIRGKVESITYQSTQIVTIEGSVIAFLNSNLFVRSFKNLTRNHDFELVKLPIDVSYGTNITSVRDLLTSRINSVIEGQNFESPDIDSKKGVNVVFDSFGENGVKLFVVLWVRIETKLKTCSIVNEIVYNTLNENNITIPFPQRIVHVNQ